MADLSESERDYIEMHGLAAVRRRRDENLELARLTRLSPSPSCWEICKQSVVRARYWNRLLVAGAA